MADKVIISKSKLVALGDVIREKTGSSDKMTVDVMTETMRNHSGGSGMPDLPHNNPDLPNLYHGMSLTGKKLKINLRKAFEALWDPRDGDVEQNGLSLIYGTAYGKGTEINGLFRFFIYLYGDNRVNYPNFYSESHMTAVKIRVSSEAGGIIIENPDNYSKQYLCVPLESDRYADKTIGEIFDELGVIEIDFDTQIIKMAIADPSVIQAAMLVTIGGYNFGWSTYLADLNETPIDYMWFE